MSEEKPSDSKRLEDLFIHPRKILPEFPAVTVTDETAAMIRNGRPVNLPEYTKAPLVRVFVGQKKLIAICQRVAGTLFRPKTVVG